MKTKTLVTLQIVLLLGAMIAGFVLKGDLAHGPRMAHRFFGTFAALVSIVTAGGLVSQKSRPKNIKYIALAAAIFALLAGAAGKMVKAATNYSLVFNTMRASAALALLASIALLVVVSQSPKKSTHKK